MGTIFMGIDTFYFCGCDYLDSLHVKEVYLAGHVAKE
jgi:hypothetical protein